jgi:hypothetical protein
MTTRNLRVDDLPKTRGRPWPSTGAGLAHLRTEKRSMGGWEMTDNLQVEVVRDGIVVTIPGTHFKVVYQKCFEAPGLVATSGWTSDDLDAPITPNEFRALAWRAANDKARELGWVV